MDNALIVDVETTGLDPETDTVIEVGAVLYSIKHQTTLTQFSAVLFAEENPCEHINRIPVAACREAPTTVPGQQLSGLASQAGVVVAHNAEFDRQFLTELENPWLCTMDDFKWPNATREGGSLIHLALDHGIGVSSAHRALTDCQLIAALFDRMDDLTEMFRVAMRPKGMFVAQVSYEDRQLAKDAGFKWDPDGKKWYRGMAIEDAAQLSFPTRQIDN